ncbi:ComEA family DNA-binding protein [Lactiplantibacillus carotarum]|uniref:ComEA family DNA-binding protein n=1 Tax=Lactiplantibacillus carotarum TaxID=2993456 RepID=UPI00298F1345|nr:helix-hairpin-helix domain-containing protein [Lactiplantibacillus carotarum]
MVSGPPAGSVTAPTSATRTTSATGTPHAPVNINTADVATFQTIKGIGQKKAEKIIAYRQAHGDFKRIEDLKQVGGSATKRLQSLKTN